MHRGPPPPRTSSLPSMVITARSPSSNRSEEHTSELQSPCNLVCRLLLEKKKKTSTRHASSTQLAQEICPTTHNLTQLSACRTDAGRDQRPGCAHPHHRSPTTSVDTATAVDCCSDSRTLRVRVEASSQFTAADVVSYTARMRDDRTLRPNI